MTHRTEIKSIIHDCDTGQFEAQIVLSDGDLTTTHVVHLPGVISTPFAFLQPALIKAANLQRDRGEYITKSTRVLSAAEMSCRTAFEDQSLLDAILKKAA